MPVLIIKMCVCHQCNIILVITRVETRTTALNTVLERVALGRLAPGSADGSHYTYTCCSQVTCSRRCSARDYSRAHGSAPLVHCPVTSYMPTARAATGMRRHAHSDTRTTMTRIIDQTRSPPEQRATRPQRQPLRLRTCTDFDR